MFDESFDNKLETQQACVSAWDNGIRVVIEVDRLGRYLVFTEHKMQDQNIPTVPDFYKEPSEAMKRFSELLKFRKNKKYINRMEIDKETT